MEQRTKPDNDINKLQIVKGLKDAFRTGKTVSYEWRRQQLGGVLKLLDENKEEIMKSLKQDLHKVR